MPAPRKELPLFLWATISLDSQVITMLAARFSVPCRAEPIRRLASSTETEVPTCGFRGGASVFLRAGRDSNSPSLTHFTQTRGLILTPPAFRKPGITFLATRRGAAAFG